MKIKEYIIKKLGGYTEKEYNQIGYIKKSTNELINLTTEEKQIHKVCSSYTEDREVLENINDIDLKRVLIRNMEQALREYIEIESEEIPYMNLYKIKAVLKVIK